jgi:hypothetical protein
MHNPGNDSPESVGYLKRIQLFNEEERGVFTSPAASKKFCDFFSFEPKKRVVNLPAGILQFVYFDVLQ